jgi:hypothetical protein
MRRQASEKAKRERKHKVKPEVAVGYSEQSGVLLQEVNVSKAGKSCTR